jgi:MFS transporter, OFA family, oxalate/formate antiporter
MTSSITQHRHSRLVSRSPVFYGWIVWCVATIGWIATSPGQAFSISLFVNDFIRDFNMDRTTLSGIFALGTLIGSASLTYIGRSIDRYGNRKVGVVICIAFMFALFAWSSVRSPFALLLGFIAVRTLGQGALSLVNTTAIAAWFWKRRGLMMSVSLMLFSLWQAVYVPFVQQLLEIMDWHRVWILLGLAVGLLVLPLTWLLLRDHPEDYGLLPDGELPQTLETRRVLPEENWTLREAMNTWLLWIFVFGRIVSPAWGSGLVLHNTLIFNSMGYSARVAAETFSQVMLLSAAFSLIFGFLIDRIRPGWVLAIQVLAMAGTLFVLTLPPEPALLPIYTLSLSLVMGGGAVFDTSAWANLFGRQSQGVIRGFVTTILIAATAMGPILFGLSYDLFGSYSPVFWLGIVLALPSVVLCMFTNKPHRRTLATKTPAPVLVRPLTQPAAGD